MSTDQRIFISYRRSDCQPQANGLNDGLRNRLPDAQVFMDLDSIPPGADFEEHIRNEIDQCDVVLVLIGDEWLAPQPGTSTRRIDQPNDFVRLEVVSALSSPTVRVIPVLVEGATMPSASELPDDMARLARLNAYVLSDSHWGRDITELTNFLRGPGAEAQTQAGAASAQATLPPPVAASQLTSAPGSSTPSVQPAPTGDGASSPEMKKWMVWLPVYSFGLLAFVPPIWAASQLKHDPDRRRKLYLVAGVLALGSVVAFALIGSSPEDAEGSSTGAASNIGTTLAVVCLVAGIIVSLRNRRPSPALAGIQHEMARRDLRQQYRQLLTRDPNLGASMRIGRPDLGRDYDDGGLVDLNSIPAEGLQRFLGMSRAETAEVLRARAQLGRLSSVDELEAFTTLSPVTLARLREVAVFV